MPFITDHWFHQVSLPLDVLGWSRWILVDVSYLLIEFSIHWDGYDDGIPHIHQSLDVLGEQKYKRVSPKKLIVTFPHHILDTCPIHRWNFLPHSLSEDDDDNDIPHIRCDDDDDIPHFHRDADDQKQHDDEHAGVGAAAAALCHEYIFRLPFLDDHDDDDHHQNYDDDDGDDAEDDDGDDDDDDDTLLCVQERLYSEEDLYSKSGLQK